MNVKLLICDDEKMIREGLASLDWNTRGIEVVGTAKNGEVAFELFQKMLPDIVISDIKMPIVIPTVDVQNSKKYIITNHIPERPSRNTEYINNISIGKAIRASSSFPVVFSPCEFNNHKFLDGGILDNFPTIEVKKQGVDKIITVNFKADDIDESSNIMDIVMRTIDIMGNKISEENISNSDMLLTIQTDKTGLLETEKLDDCYKYGYRQTIENMDKIKEIMDN